MFTRRLIAKQLLKLFTPHSKTSHHGSTHVRRLVNISFLITTPSFLCHNNQAATPTSNHAHQPTEFSAPPAPTNRNAGPAFFSLTTPPVGCAPPGNAPLDLNIKQKDLNASVTFAMGVVNNLRRLENNLVWADVGVKSGTPSHGVFVSFAPEREAVRRGRDALVAVKATVQLMNKFCNKRSLSHQDCVKSLTRYKFDKTPLVDACIRQKKQCLKEDYLSVYRKFDGSCNHVSNGIKGESFTGFTRLLYPDYLDGVQEPRRSVTKRALPSPRLISTSLVRHLANYDDTMTMAVMQWAQFIEHDLSRTAQAIMIHRDNTIECCGIEGDNLSPRYIHPFCSPIAVPGTDKSYSDKAVDCLSYVRSIPALRQDCSFGPANQVNQATHFLDGSQIYGSTNRKLATLRLYYDGMLDTSTFHNRSFLPLSDNPSEDCQTSMCFKSGDPRVNFQPQLTVMHTLWFREHNRIARELAKMNRHWDDNTVFEEARRIVIAEMQHITYNGWLNKVLDPKYIRKIENYGIYNESVDPSISNSFATAAMRSLKSLYDSELRLYTEKRKVVESISWKNYFNNPVLLERQGVLDSLIRGLATQSCMKLDINYAEDLVNKLYTNGNFGFDVVSFDIQRGRDHGLPSYVAYRTLCGLPTVKTFADFKDVMEEEHAKILSQVYASPKDVDLIIGGLLEQPEGSSIFGPTFSCIVADQFLRTRRGDRYFYTNKNQPKPFTDSQLNEIGKVTLARIFCDNGDHIEYMQENVFTKLGPHDFLIKCDYIPKMSLSPWYENRDKYF